MADPPVTLSNPTKSSISEIFWVGKLLIKAGFIAGFIAGLQELL